MIAAREPRACRVGGAKPDSRASDLAPTASRGCRCVAVSRAICARRILGLGSPTGIAMSADAISADLASPVGSVPSVSAVTAIGTITRSTSAVESGWPHDRIQDRSAPHRTASTTSLTLQSWDRAISLASDSWNDASPTRLPLGREVRNISARPPPGRRIARLAAPTSPLLARSSAWTSLVDRRTSSRGSVARVISASRMSTPSPGDGTGVQVATSSSSADARSSDMSTCARSTALGPPSRT